MCYPFLIGATWVYSLIFLAVAILPAIRIASTLLGSIEKWTTLLHKGISEISGEFDTCPNCGKKVPNGSLFCPYCGSKIAEAKSPEER
ncbi:zinc ribbon domain-containing protein [Candidatus Methanodesulfokora washburnensis]|uniref:Zinc ribbon domain-containing protein n=2 Tax=Candidatus Methanodesulfokora washburnensis TaxID=2478471 RepID=A0A429GRQ5_9CREN|nr:zinc ribbon domain-containing protein [Candidatus Methanodesulfokores washburnensis]